MPTNAPLTVDLRDVFFLSPHLVLTFWGLLVLWWIWAWRSV